MNDNKLALEMRQLADEHARIRNHAFSEECHLCLLSRDELCAECGDLRDQHDFPAGNCIVRGCACKSYVSL